MDNSTVIYGPDLKMEVNEKFEKNQGFVNSNMDNLAINYGPTLKAINEEDSEENLEFENKGKIDITNDIKNIVEELKESSDSATSTLNTDGEDTILGDPLMKTPKDDLDNVPTHDINTIEKEVEDEDERKSMASDLVEKHGIQFDFATSILNTDGEDTISGILL